MRVKRLLTFSFFIFLGIFAILKVLSVHRNNPSFMTQLSQDTLVLVEPSKKSSFFGINFSIISDITSAVSDIHSDVDKAADDIASELPQISLLGSESNYLQNACLNGQDPSSMGVQDQLLQFIQGPCLPVVLIPGILATKLEVNIDCETLQSQNPEIFKSCGWSTCSSWDVFKEMPDSQYTLWISDLSSPMSIVFKDTALCWGNLIQLEYNPEETDIPLKYSSPAGVQVVVKSQTTNNQEQCGLSAEDNLLASPVQYSYTKGYEVMKNAFIAMGYQVGLTLYGAPYDWRKTTVANGISDNLYSTIQQIYSLTGKPTVLVAHSLGNFGALHLLNSMSQEEKDQYIFNYVSLMNPLSGAPSGIANYVGGDTDYTFHSFGVNFDAQKNFMKANSGAFDCMAKDPFTQFADAQWMSEWKARISLENNIEASTPEGQAAWESVINAGNYTYQWFPTPLKQCFRGFENRSDQCGLFMYDWSTEPMFTIQDQVYTGTLDDIAEVFENYVTTTENYASLAEDSRSNDIYLINNPGVPTTVVYGSHLPTKKAYVYDYDPSTVTSGGNFATANITTYSQGDETVPTTSSLMAALKWSWEFENKEQAGLPNAQPVKTVEVCSIYNNRNTIYDVVDSDAPYEVLTNEYIGVGCDCMPEPGKTTSGADCTHAAIVLDSVLIKFIQNIVHANAPNPNYNQTGAALLNDTQLAQLATNCPTVVIGTNLYNQLINEAMSDASENSDDSEN